MKKFLLVLILAFLTISIVGCSEKAQIRVDYPNESEFEEALNAGEVVDGKIVTFTVEKFVPNSAFGYNLQAGEHLNFCSPKNPNVKDGDTLTVKVVEVTSVLGSYIISYEKVE